MEPEGQRSNGLSDIPPANNGVDQVTAMNGQASVADANTAVVPPQVNQKKTFNKKTGLIAGIAIAVLALAGSASAYQFWYQHPDKIMADAITHMMATKQSQVTGDVVIDSEDVRLTVDIKTNGDEQNTNMVADVSITPKTEETKFLGEIKLGAEVIVVASGDYYFKIKDIKPVVDKLIDASIQMQIDQGYAVDGAELDSQRAEVERSINPVVSKIDNRWIKVTADDLRQENDDTQACFVDAIEKINNDDAMREQLVDTYKEHRFILVDKELGVKDGNIGYQLKLDETAAESFGKAAQDTKFGNELKKCDKDIFEDTGDIASPATDDGTEVTTEVWITRWSHQLSALKMDISNKEEKLTGALNFNFVMDKSDEVVIPSDATSITELQADIMELMSGATSAASLSA